MSVLVEMLSPQDQLLATATAFIVARGDSRYLVTNRHCLTGKDARNQYLSREEQVMPESIISNFHFGFVGFGRARVALPLYDDDHRPLWFEHPQWNRRFDVAALPLPEDVADPIDPSFRDYVVDEETFDSQGVTVGTELFVVGYPFSIHAEQHGLATWTRATVASEPSFPYAGRPCFLIDARTRTGQSGSPVLYHQNLGISANESGRFYPGIDRLMGVYSGRVRIDSDLGYVWRPEVIREVIDGKHRPDDTDAIPDFIDVGGE